MALNTGLISAILEGIIRSLPSDAVKSGLDKFLDYAEDAISKSDNKFDDAIVMPLLKALRSQLGIEEIAGSKYADNQSEVNVNINVNKPADQK